MIRLIITADDKLYERLARRAQDEGDMAKRAASVLDGLRQTIEQPPDMIVIDMSLHAADTLLETLHSRQDTAAIPLLAVTVGGNEPLPFELRRLCAAVLGVESL